MRTIVVINEAHRILPEQEKILREKFGDYDLLRVPAKGWTRKEMDDLIPSLMGNKVVCISPVPYLLGMLSAKVGFELGYSNSEPGEVYIFHNDHREKVELPDGRVIFKIPTEGWELVQIC